MHFSEWVICQGHRHENRIDRRATRWRTTAIRSSSWSSDWAVWPWVPEGRSKWFLLAQHQGLLEDMDTCFQAIRKNTSSCAFTFKKPGKICHDKMIFWCHLFEPNCSFFNTLPCDNSKKSFSWLVQPNPLCSCGQSEEGLAAVCLQLFAALSLAMC